MMAPMQHHLSWKLLARIISITQFPPATLTSLPLIKMKSLCITNTPFQSLDVYQSTIGSALP
jgi:hypothetical protein